MEIDREVAISYTISEDAARPVHPCDASGVQGRRDLPPIGELSYPSDQPTISARRLRAWKSRAPTAPRWICMMVATSFCLKPQK